MTVRLTVRAPAPPRSVKPGDTFELVGTTFGAEGVVTKTGVKLPPASERLAQVMASGGTSVLQELTQLHGTVLFGAFVSRARLLIDRVSEDAFVLTVRIESKRGRLLLDHDGTYSRAQLLRGGAVPLERVTVTRD